MLCWVLVNKVCWSQKQPHPCVCVSCYCIYIHIQTDRQRDRQADSCVYVTLMVTSLVLIQLTQLPRYICYLKWVIFKLISRIGIMSISYEIALRSMLKELTYDESTLVQGMAWCRQETSHYLSQYWAISIASHSITVPKWVIRTFVVKQ